MQPHTLIQSIAWRIAARQNCARMNNPEWFARHTEQLDKLAGELPPVTRIDLDASTTNRIVLLTEYHHMNDGGYYDGWTTHRVIVQPDLLSGFNVTITGRDRNDIKDYLADVFRTALAEVSPQEYQPTGTPVDA